MGEDFAGFSHGRASVDGGQLHYLLGGEGETVVLLHGWPQHSLQWHAVAPALAEWYRVVVPDPARVRRLDDASGRRVRQAHHRPDGP